MIKKYIFMTVTRIVYVAIIFYVFARLEGRTEKILVSLFGIIYVAVESTMLLRVKSNDLIRLELAELRSAIGAFTSPGSVGTDSIVAQARAALDDEKKGSGIHAAYLLIVMALCLMEFFATI